MIRIIFTTLLILLLANYIYAQIGGCTDLNANNYNAQATFNDGSCTYDPVIIDPLTSWNLPDNVLETSGLIIWEDKIWTHNDDTDINIYAFNPEDAFNNQEYPMTGTVNVDWEEISHDSKYIYLGDFGNNSSGNRTELHILRIEKESVLTNTPVIDTIEFSYSLQTDLNPSEPNQTDFDCEAFVVTSDSIYLFTKEWISNKSSIYSLPKIPGEYVAKFQSSYNVDGLITGATYLEANDVIVLCGYSAVLQPFLYLLYDFNNNLFFDGNKRKILLDLMFHQVEGICTEDGLVYYLSNEKIAQTITIDQKLHKVDLTDYLEDYLTSVKADVERQSEFIEVYPNPSRGLLFIKSSSPFNELRYKISDMSGKTILKGEFTRQDIQMDIKNIKKGTYILTVISPTDSVVKKIIKN